jgi:hypothetical protein
MTDAVSVKHAFACKLNCRMSSIKLTPVTRQMIAVMNFQMALRRRQRDVTAVL